MSPFTSTTCPRCGSRLMPVLDPDLVGHDDGPLLAAPPVHLACATGPPLEAPPIKPR